MSIFQLSHLAQTLGIAQLELFNNLKIYLEDEGFNNIQISFSRRTRRYNISFYSAAHGNFLNGVSMVDKNSDLILVNKKRVFELFDQGAH